MPEKIRISDGNMKLGKIPNLSLAPGVTCSSIANKTCYSDGCYARKAYRAYPKTKNAWDINTKFAMEDLNTMKQQLSEYFAKYKPKFFRIHVSGDFISIEYATMWKDVIAEAQDTRFLAFTKQFDIVKSIEWPKNASIIFSAWPGMYFDRDKFQVAWMDDGQEKRIPSDAIECPGSCEHCNMCFNLPSIGRDVVFHKH